MGYIITLDKCEETLNPKHNGSVNQIWKGVGWETKVQTGWGKGQRGKDDDGMNWIWKGVVWEA